MDMQSIELTLEIERCEHLIALAYTGNLRATVELWARIVNLENDHLRVTWIKRFTEMINPQPAKVTTIQAIITKIES